MNAPEKLTAPHVYQAINAVMAELAKEGIAKARRTESGARYNFRGIDDIYNVVSPLLVANQLCILPRVTDRQSTKETTKNGGNLFYTTVQAEFDIVSTVDGSRHTIMTVGEAMDSSDKSSTKAMSIAYRSAVIMAFGIPTEGDNDPENQEFDLGESETLKKLLAAASKGMDEFQKVGAEVKGNSDFRDVWRRHGESLKQSAAEADNG